MQRFWSPSCLRWCTSGVSSGCRFSRMVGLTPMEYLLAWRMAVAKDLLRRKDVGLDEVAEQVGYSSASTFSTAFSRHVGRPPGRYAREDSSSATMRSA